MTPLQTIRRTTPPLPRRLPLLPLLALLAVCWLIVVAPAATGAGPTPARDPAPVGGWPLHPRPAVVARFDAPDTPYGPGHRGVDLLGRPGQPVRTALPGRVRFSGQVAGRAVVVVGHGPTRTTYQPVVGSLAVGTRVRTGDVIGHLVPRGSHCFPRSCLHWGWRDDSTYFDPLLLVGLGPVRLLPLWRAEPFRLADGPAGRPVATGRW